MKVFRLIILILHVGILFLLLGTLMNAYVPPKIFPWFNLLSLGFPVLIILYALLTLFWLFSWKKRTFAFMLAGLIFMNPVQRWVNFSSDKKETANLKIVSFNVKAGLMGPTDIEKYLNRADADVVMLQEAGSKISLKGMTGIGDNGVLKLFSKHKVVESKELIKSDFYTNNAYASQTDIEIKGKVYRFINVYLEPFKFEKGMVKIDGVKEEDEQKLKNIVRRLIPVFKKHQDQVDTIKEAIENSPYPVIIAGDLNSVPNSYEYYHLGDGLDDAFVKAGKGSATSFHDYKFPIRIDYIFTSKTVQPLTYTVDRSVKLSDHYPVIATFSLNH
ncbi:endonuclease/exonuclease/phosphatase family protein [Chryseobacterium carnipullorum]|uniref:endonuclease/exonuclease/phosphatase family protein n=1 Tax=Chryseobacterium carnipullorum TaxID=1124835 RepID=UPI000E940AEC|nr:endonuclease/exonuclease/phosphatase family protein [Chryseobacterium carnipullorum]MDN5395299.1 endonuclease/exonuclease/phosphatase family protein [Chryseobacterium sp.]MDN5422077.1 endonuclease/exonuclease/phosphatase family protein [Chryseobacterium sp.]MDN5475611.1 endonuclease/exonuclease/phosphatase family protein [Chryseobacterium sp.]MDN5479936.1 endonuclease/exonuclease/phosphatase family protein [Chryseobacterium sp.]HBV17815.1 AP endonuclease [Chryseobacterium carnipullorum]